MRPKVVLITRYLDWLKFFVRHVTNWNKITILIGVIQTTFMTALQLSGESLIKEAVRDLPGVGDDPSSAARQSPYAVYSLPELLERLTLS